MHKALKGRNMLKPIDDHEQRMRLICDLSGLELSGIQANGNNGFRAGVLRILPSRMKDID